MGPSDGLFCHRNQTRGALSCGARGLSRGGCRQMYPQVAQTHRTPVAELAKERIGMELHTHTEHESERAWYTSLWVVLAALVVVAVVVVWALSARSSDTAAQQAQAPPQTIVVP